ncbi:MAG: tryptophan ABC transporter substrate-binding protein [Lactobacillus sp.]
MKRMLAVIAVLAIFLAGAFFTESNQQKSQAARPKVGVLTLMRHPALDQIYRGFRHELRKEMGDRVKIDYQNANGDQSNLATMAARLSEEDNQLLVGITTPAAQALANRSGKTPLLLGAVTDPQSAHLVKNAAHPGGHITGVSDQAPIGQQLQLIKAFVPNLKTLGVIYTSSDSSAVAGYRKIAAECKKQGIHLRAYSIANSNDLNQVSEQMLSQVDAVITPTDNTIAGAMRTLVKNANAAGKPVFPAVASMVKQGGVATYSINQYQLGVEIAKMSVRILKGKQKSGDLTVYFAKKGTPTLNLKQARQLHLHVPARFMKECARKGVIYR